MLPIPTVALPQYFHYRIVSSQVVYSPPIVLPYAASHAGSSTLVQPSLPVHVDDSTPSSHVPPQVHVAHMPSSSAQSAAWYPDSGATNHLTHIVPPADTIPYTGSG